MLDRDLPRRDIETLILFHSYSDEGRVSMTVSEIVDAFADVHDGAEDDWNWHSKSRLMFGNSLRMLEARSLVASDGANPASWTVTEFGQRYIDAVGDKAAKLAVLNEGYERYIQRLDDSHSHSSVRT